MFTHKRADFGDGFVFGTATASYQIEGGQTDGRGPSIWDSFSRTPGNVVDGDTGEIACDHYNRWAEDLDLLREGGFDAYRFSFAWPRLIPEGTGRINQAGIDYYDRVIDGMLARGLKPFATLYHWDLPSALQDKGGWMNRDIADWFTDYALLIHNHFGDRLHAVATINEPWCVAWLSHFWGAHAPGYRDIRATARAMHHVLLSHGRAVNALRAEGQDNLGIVVNLQKAEPASDSPEDVAANHLFDGIFNRWYLGGVTQGEYPADVVEWLGANLPDSVPGDMNTVGADLDWLGINYYSRSLMAHNPESPYFPVKEVPGPLEKTEMGWEIYPKGLTDLLTRVATDYFKGPIYITENGMAEVRGTDDPRRIKFYDEHFAALLNAKQNGADIRGYFAWSLLDNYEWAEGYAKRFGIVDVDYRTQKRTPKQSFNAFKTMLSD
jgi:beta-glucosidase